MSWGTENIVWNLDREAGERSPFVYLIQDHFIVISGVDKSFFYVLTDL